MNTLLHKIGSGIVGLGMLIGSWFGVSSPIEQPVNVPVEQNLGAYNISGGGTYRLKSSAGITDTTINLSSFKEPVSNLKYTMSYLNTAIGYGTVDPQNSDKTEFISFTGITQNADGSAQLTGVTRGLTRTPAGSACTASTTLAVRHAAQSIFILSDSPCHFSEYAVKRNNESVTGLWTAPDPVSAQGIATKNYVDGAALSGIGNASEIATGTVEIATQDEAIASTQSGSLGRLVLGSNLATSTYNSATADKRVIMTENDGKIDSDFLDLKDYNAQASTTQLTASTQFYSLGTTTLSATTTLDASKVLDSNSNNILWSLIASSTSNTAVGTTTISVPTRKVLRIVYFYPNGSGSNSPVIEFNGDSGINYSYSIASSTLVGFGGGGVIGIPLGWNVDGEGWGTIDIYNLPGTRKFIKGEMTQNKAASLFATTTVPLTENFSGLWATSTPQLISSISFVARTSGVFTSGLYVYIFGSSF